MKKILTIIVAACALGAAAASCSSKTSSPSDAAKLYASYLVDGKYDKFVDAIGFPADTSADEIKEKKAGLAAMLGEKASESFDEKGGLKSAEVVSETVAEDGLSAEVEMTYTYGNGETSDETMNLVNVDDKWLIDMDK